MTKPVEERAGEWQDIATAPKDGTRVLTFGCLHDDHGVDMGEVPTVQISRYAGVWYSPELGGHEPTHWMPLPAPPQPLPEPSKRVG